MLVDHFPLVGLRLTTPRLELRLPASEELAGLADLAAEGTRTRRRSSCGGPMRRQRRSAAVWSTTTGSSRYQGQGIGTEMRAAVLHLAFAGLGADEALSGALEHNLASLAVSRKLGYEPDGHHRHALDGTMIVERRLCLTRAAWEGHRTVPVGIEGLAPCLSLLGIEGLGVSLIGKVSGRGNPHDAPMDARSMTGHPCGPATRRRDSCRLVRRGECQCPVLR